MRYAPPFALLFAISAAAAPGPGSDPRAILGRWQGHSDCVRAPWNSACNDEQVRYLIEPVAGDSNRCLMHAYKAFRDSFEPMGDLSFSYRAKAGEWESEFANSRVRFQWRFHIAGDSLVGSGVMLPSGRVARHVVAWPLDSEPKPDSLGRMHVVID